MGIREIYFASPEYDQEIQLRDKILKEPLDIEFSIDELKDEWKMFHLGVFNKEQKLIACLVLEPQNNGFIKMKQVAVDIEYQGQGIGTKLVKYSESFAKLQEYQMMCLNARDTAIPFYVKLDYLQVGEMFEEVGIPHYRMEKKLK